MTIAELIALLKRRRRAALAIAAGTLMLMLLAYTVAPPTYRASSSMILINPPALPVETAGGPEIPAANDNPYARFGDLTVIVDVLTRIMQSDQTADHLASAGLDGTYEIAANSDFYRGPIIDVATESSSAEGAIDANRLVLAELQTALADLQEADGTDPTYLIKATVVVEATKATTVFTPTLRLLLVVLAAGLAVLIVSTTTLDRLAGKRPKRRPDRTRTRTHLTSTASEQATKPSEGTHEPADNDVEDEQEELNIRV